MHRKKSKKKLTLLLFFSNRTWKILKNVQNAKEKTFHFITLSQEQLKVQYIFEERHRSMRNKMPMGKVQKKVKKKLTIQHFRLHIHT